MALNLSKTYTPAAQEVADATQYNTDIAALFNAFIGIEADPPTSSVANFAIDATGELYLDGGSNTYITESSADNIRFVAGGTTRFDIGSSVEVAASTDFAVQATQKIYLDGGGNTYITEPSADQMDIFCGANRIFLLSTSIAEVDNVDFGVGATKKIYLDATGGSGGNTYIVESSADTVDVYTNGNSRLTINNNTGATGGSGSAGAGNQYVELLLNGNRYKILHDGTL